MHSLASASMTTLCAAGLLAASLAASPVTDPVWISQGRITPDDPEEGAEFGHAVAVSGDRGVIGALRDDSSATDAGSAYVVVRDGTQWSVEQELGFSVAQAGDRIGWDVSIDGDTVVVGAPSSEAAGLDSAGAAFVFVASDSGWVEQAVLTASDASTNDLFGSSVAIQGETIVVGATSQDEGAQNAGAAYSSRAAGSCGRSSRSCWRAIRG